jgi:hypothetical protein
MPFVFCSSDISACYSKASALAKSVEIRKSDFTVAFFCIRGNLIQDCGEARCTLCQDKFSPKYGQAGIEENKSADDILVAGTR